MVLGHYFNSTRLVLMGFFLVLIYAYSVLPELIDILDMVMVFGPVYNNSKILLPVIIPLTILGLHFSGDSGIFTRNGQIKVAILILEILLIPLIFPFIDEYVYRVIGYVPQKRILSGRLNLPFLSGSLTTIAYAIIWYFSGKNYYSNYLVLIFWLTLTAVLSFESGTSWLFGSLPMHHSLFFSGVGILYNSKVLNLAWGKAYRDQLTQIPGRMALDESLVRLSGLYSICMIDIDEFKDFNDTYGHDAGDKVLKQVARLLNKHTTGRAYRFGGEEFTVIYSGRSSEDVEEELESLRKTISDNKVTVTRKSKRATKQLDRKVTISLGLADSEGDYDNAEEVLNAADNALFKAKDEGRNQLVVKS